MREAREAIRQGDIPGVQLRRRQDLALGPAEAWRWLVEPERLCLWLAEEARIAGDREEELLLRITGDRGEPVRERGRILGTIPATLWVLSFERLEAGWTAPTRLTLRLAATPAGCELDVLQEGFQRLPLSLGLTAWESYRVRWRTALARLAAAVPLRSA
ncbi:MAG TPA: hypothetical protein VEL74_17315 [Thermoanaerobaculia bacterium]|nr:hypothetical protein [Thermoanaerobaculia bacterium]